MPSAGSAQHLYANQIGMFMNPDGTGASSTDQIGAPVNVYLVLIKPTNHLGVPFPGITSFDCQLNFSPIGGIFVTGNALNGPGFNIGDVGNISSGYLEFIVGFAEMVPSVDEAILLVTLQFINSNVQMVYVTMSPASIPSIPGAMGYLPGDPPLIEMYPASGHYDNPVFTFNGETVPVERESFGSLKALYR
jgi:hypothetical protein